MKTHYFFFILAKWVLRGNRKMIWFFFRVLADGIIVFFVTIFAPLLGAQLTGILLAFPIAYILIPFRKHKEFGKVIADEVVYSAIFGTVSLAVFLYCICCLSKNSNAYVPFIIKLTWIRSNNCIYDKSRVSGTKTPFVLKLVC